MGRYNYSYYLSYYQGGYGDGSKPGLTTKRIIKSEANSDGFTTDAQIKYHSELLSFLKEKGVVFGTIFDKPKSRDDCRKKINALLTILYKNNLAEEFYGNGGEEHDK